MHFYVGYDSLQSCSVCAWYTVITVSVWLTLSLGVRIRIKFNVRKLLFTGQSGTQWSKRPWLKGDGTDGTRGSQWKQLDGSDADRRNRWNQWRRKQFASGGGTMPARSAGRKIWCAPSLFSCAPHMRGHNDWSGEVGRGAIKVMGPSTYSHSQAHSISSAPTTGRPWVHYK